MRQYTTPHNTVRCQSGFTLIELAIVITIIGFFMVGLVKAYELYQADKIQREQDNRMDEMRAALAKWIQDEQCVDNDGDPHDESWCVNNGTGGEYLHLANEGLSGSQGDGRDAVRFPCPADPGVAPGKDHYATEVDNSGGACDTSGTAIDTIKESGTTVAYRGAFPAKTVGLQPSIMIDPYGNKYSYVVSKNVIATNALQGANPEGDLTISDGGTTYPSRFALFSHGKNGAGAYNKQGKATNISAGSPIEAKNLDNKSEFAFRQDQFRAQGASYYDDAFAASLVDETDDGWWHATDNSAQDITHRNPGDVIMGTSGSGNVGIGTPNPQNKLDLQGGNATFQGGQVGIGRQNPDTVLDIEVASKSDNIASKRGLMVRDEGPGLTLWDTVGNRHKWRLQENGGDFNILFDGNPPDGTFDNFLEIRENSGNVGIGTTSPKKTLEVDGEIKIGSESFGSTCSAEGAMRYNTSKSRQEFCDGNKWRGFGAVDYDNCNVIEQSVGKGNSRTISCSAGKVAVNKQCVRSGTEDGMDHCSWNAGEGIYVNPDDDGWNVRLRCCNKK